MKAGDNLQWFKKGEEVPDGSRLIKIEKFIVGYEHEDEGDYHQLQMGNSYPVYEERYLYEMPDKTYFEILKLRFGDL